MQKILLAAGAGAVLVCLIVVAAAFLGANRLVWVIGALVLVAIIALVRWFRESKPDDDHDNKPMTLGTRRLLIFYLVAICLLLRWPDPLADQVARVLKR